MAERVIAIIAEELKVEKETIQYNSALVDDLEANFPDMVVLLIKLEEEFGMTMTDGLDGLKRVGDFIEYIQQRL